MKNNLTERMESLHNRLQWVSKNTDKQDGVYIGNNKIHVEKLEKDTPEEAMALSEKLYNMIPRIKLPDLLIEVSGWTNFDRNFIHASTGNTAKNEEKSILMAALMVMGTNIGLSKMADSTPGITYRQMANTVQWRMYDDAMKRAQATLVNYQHKQFLASYWGDGSTSSSDGMRVQVGVSSLHAEHNPHYGSEKGTTMYRFVSDQFSSFYTKVINTNARDAVHVIDGLLYHETELCIEEHYTDTAGYTDQVFGLSHLLGLLATALREMGRIEKTIFILDYISNESLRRRIQKGLNKGEAVNALARAIFLGKRGELRERELQDQLQRASALNILINAISIWNTTYLQKAIDYLKSTGDFNENLLKNIAPLGWEHINFLGDLSFQIPLSQFHLFLLIHINFLNYLLLHNFSYTELKSTFLLLVTPNKPMSSIFSPKNQGKNRAFFSLIFARFLFQNHNILW
nr:transposase [uncultured Clostridium sp.]